MIPGYPQVPDRSLKICECPIKSWKIPENPGKVPEIPENPRKSQKIPENSRKSQRIPGNSRKLLENLEKLNIQFYKRNGLAAYRKEGRQIDQ